MKDMQPPDEWQLTTLSAIAKPEYGLVDGPFGSSLPASEYTDHGIPVIRGSNLSMGKHRFDDSEFVFVSEATAQRLSRSLCRANDIIVTKKGTLGQTGIVPEHSQYSVFLVSSNQMKLSVREDVADPLFVYYWIASPNSIAKIQRDAEATGVPKTNLQYLRKFPIRLPPFAEQRAIAAILGALDDKIELNRRMNATLEAMARAIFQSWFVDFDPVRAKSEGRETGLPSEVDVLFPFSFVESQIRTIPADWQAETVRDVCSHIFSGGTPSTNVKEFWGGDLPWLSSGETRSKFIISTEKTITDAAVANSSTRFARCGATVVAGAGQGYTRGQTSLLRLDTYINQSVVALEARKDRVSDTYLFLDLERRYDEFRGVSDSHSSRGSLTTKLLAGLPFVVPPVNVVNTFDAIVAPLLERIDISLLQSNALAELRDALLPKLISGELRVPEAERLAVEAGL